MTELQKQLAERNITVFLEAYGISNDQGEKLDFKQHKFLRDIYEDMSPIQCVMKAAQIGLSTLTHIKALWVAKNKKMDIIYSYPSAADVKENVSGKTNRLISNNPIFLEWTQDKDSIEQKRVGGNTIYYRGTWTERAALAIPADLYISDEIDRSKQDIVRQYESRLQHSKYAWKWYLSNPSAPGNGVDRIWQESDQKHWIITCTCGRQWYLEMKNIMYKDGVPYFGCTKCNAELDRNNGRWVANKTSEISGYWISLLMCPWVSAKTILEKQKEYNEEQFANFVLGIPYVGKGNVLTQNLFFQNLTDRINPQDTRPIIGVDTGNDMNYVIGNKYGIYYYNKCSDYSELEKLMERFPNAMMIIDGGGDISGPKRLKERFVNRVYSCFFRPDRKNDEVLTWKDDDQTVLVDRNKILQTVVDELTERRIPIYGSEAEWWDYWLEWKGMYRTNELNSLDVPVHHWNKPSTGRCDYPFATVYWRIGMERFMEQYATFNAPATNIGFAGSEVLPDNTMFLPKRL